MRRALCSFLAVVALLAACADAPTVDEVVAESRVAPTESCLAEAEKRVAGWKAQKLPAKEIERRRALAAVSCAGAEIDSATAVFVGQANVDYFLLANQLIARSLSAGDYERRLRDRRRKIRLARQDPSWIADWITGDADGDLIPDKRDRCPAATPALEPTGDDGCPPETPGTVRDDKKLVSRLLENAAMLRNPECDGAALPSMPAPIEMGLGGSPSLTLSITRVTNQPPGCVVFYEISADTLGGPQPHSYSHAMFASTENGTPDPDKVKFQILPGATGGRGRLLGNFPTGTGTAWKVRALNGNGLASDWSPRRLSPKH